MADQNKIVYNIKVNAEQGTATIRDLKGQIVATQVPLDQLRGKFGNFAKTVNSADFNKFNKGLKASTAELENANKQTGAATSATLEFGRVLSDAPYGIRGVANNVQQLASNLFFMGKQVDKTTGKAIGFGGAMKQLGKNLLGPAGVLVAFQGFIALIDWMSNRTNKAKKQIDTFNESLTENNLKVEKMRALASIVGDNTKSIETQKDAMIDLKKLGFDPAKKSLDDFIKSQEKLAVVNASIKAIEELLGDVMKKRLKLNAKARKEYTQYFDMLNEGAAGIDIQKAVLEQLKLDQSDLDKEEGEIKKQYQDLIARALDLSDGSGKGLGKISILKDPKEFNEDAEDYLSQIRKLDEKTEILNAKTQAAKIIIQRRYHLEDLRRKDEENRDEYEKEAEAYRAKLNLFLDDQVARGKMSQSDADSRLSTFDNNVKAELAEMDKNFPILLQKWESYYDQRISLAKEKEMMGFKPKKDDSGEEVDPLQARLEKQMFYAEQFMMVQQGLTDFLDGEFQRQIITEQNKTNAINNELRERLNNENLSAGERKNIQLKIARNDEALRKKQEKIEKKRFKMQKAANISQALISTYLAAAQVQANPLFIDPVTKSIAMAATITSGLLNVATIARQKFQSSAGATTPAGALGGGGSGGADRSFNFNLAGASQENQLAQTLQSQFDQPIQTYVVARDITNQQQLDQDILSNASFG